MKRTNKKGGAAIVAVLIVIMLVAVGSQEDIPFRQARWQTQLLR